MCSKDINFVWLLVKNNIPLVLFFNEYGNDNIYNINDENSSEIYIFVSEEVKQNICIPILEKQYLINKKRICRQFWSIDSNCKPDFAVIKHFCCKNRNHIYIVSLKNTCYIPLKVFYKIYNCDTYYGIKNKHITVYKANQYSKIIEKYLL
jgi:hypothetical protein